MAIASSSLIVNVSGCVWSSLFLDHASSLGDQEGFLFGDVMTQTNTDISDSQMTRKTEQISINIYSHYACSDSYSFYDRKGRADQVKLLSMLKSNYKHTVGWYRFRRNTMLEPSMRETTVHHQLVNLLLPDSPHLFLLGLFTSGISWNQSTHSFNHQLLTLKDRAFGYVQVRVINLGDTSHSEYKRSASMGTTAQGRGVYSNILNNFRGRLVDYEGGLQGVGVIQGINETVYSKMQTLKNKIGESEKLLQRGIEEVQELQEKKKERERREAQQTMEQQIRTAATNPGPPDASLLLDIPVLVKATVHHPTNPPSSHQKQPLVPSLAATRASPLKSSPANPTRSLISSLGTTSTSTTHAKMSLTKPQSNPKVKVVSPEDSSSKDPFAGLFKDMKRSIQKPSTVEELDQTTARSTRAHSWDKTRDAEPRAPSPRKHRACNSMDTTSGRFDTSSPERRGRGSGAESSPQRWNTEDSDEATQLPDYKFSASPTF